MKLLFVISLAGLIAAATVLKPVEHRVEGLFNAMEAEDNRLRTLNGHMRDAVGQMDSEVEQLVRHYREEEGCWIMEPDCVTNTQKRRHAERAARRAGEAPARHAYWSAQLAEVRQATEAYRKSRVAKESTQE